VSARAARAFQSLPGSRRFPPDYTTIPAIALFYPEEYGLSTDELARPHRRRSRTGADRRDVRYAGVAYLYSEKVRAGSRRVAEEIAEQLGGGYDAKRVRHMISQARHKGFLTGTERGRARGELTEKGREVLREGREAVANARRQRRANDAETHVPGHAGDMLQSTQRETPAASGISMGRAGFEPTTDGL
jgi:hypothetical protein